MDRWGNGSCGKCGYNPCRCWAPEVLRENDVEICESCQHVNGTEHAPGCSQSPARLELVALRTELDEAKATIAKLEARARQVAENEKAIATRLYEVEKVAHAPIPQTRIEARIAAVENRLGRALASVLVDEFAGKAVSATSEGCDERKKT